jgi:hypothetical protein
MTQKANWVDINPLGIEALDKVRKAGLQANAGFLKLKEVVANLGWPGDSRRHQTAVAKALKSMGFRKVRVCNGKGTKYEYKYLHKDRVLEAQTMARGGELVESTGG